MKLSTSVIIAFLLSFHFAFATIINVSSEQPSFQAGIDASVDGDLNWLSDNTDSSSIHNILRRGGDRLVIVSEDDERRSYDYNTDTWEDISYSGQWNNWGMAAAYDIESDRMIVVSHQGPCRAYDWNNDSWTDISNPYNWGTYGMVAAYDIESDRIIVVPADSEPVRAYDFNTDTWVDLDNPGNWGSNGIAGAYIGGLSYLHSTIIEETFDHYGSLAPDWTIESHTPSRSTQWTPLQDDGNDWSVKASQTQFQEPFAEWLISPIFDLSNYVDLELSFWHDYMHDASETKLKYSVNGGASWELLSTFSSSISGTEVFDISNWVDEQVNVRFLFTFTGEFMSNASWNVDDFQLAATLAFDDVPPTASDPIPPQPMVGHWNSLTGTIGCTFSDPSGVDAASLQVRIDADGDGDYEDGGAENWTDVPGFDSSNEILVTTDVTYSEGLENMAFEFRAGDLSELNDIYGYSGYGNAEGIADDWAVTIFFDGFPPVFSDPLPMGQPEPVWIDDRTVNVGCTVWDSTGTVDAATLEMRLDLNSDLDYDDIGEEWIELTGYSNSEYVNINEEVTFSADGVFQVEFQATDIDGNGPTYSMSEEGIVDDILVRIDTTPPTASYLYLQGTGGNTATLLFSPTNDMTFLRYEVYYSLDSLVDESDELWTSSNDPALGEITTSSTTVTGLEYGTPYWFRMRAVDEAGHDGDWSNTVHSLTAGTPLAPIADLNAETTEGGLLLSWSEPTEDENGNTPVYIVGYDIHTSIDPFFTPSVYTKIASVATNSFLHDVELSGGLQSFYRVVGIGCGSAGVFSVTFGGSDDEYGKSIHNTTDGGYIIAGSTKSFGNGGADFWLLKIDSEGNEQWNQSLGGSNDEYGNSVQQTTDGGYIVLGRAVHPTHWNNVWLVKTDSAGSEEWNEMWLNSDTQIGYSVQQTTDGGYILAGNIVGDGWLIKTDSGGNEEWNSSWGGSYGEIFYSVRQTLDGGYIATGSTGSHGNGGSDVWLVKSDSEGNPPIWHRTFGGSLFERGKSVQQTLDGGFVIVGYTESLGNGGYDVWLIKTDSSGIEEWSLTIGGVDDDIGESVQQTSDGGYIITGYTSSFGNGGEDVLLIKVTSDGFEEWNQTFGGVNNDQGHSVLQTLDSGYIIAGHTSSFGSGGTDVWLIKTDSRGNTVPIE